MRMTRVLILLLGTFFIFQGCATTAHYAAPYDSTWNATMSTMKDMNMKIYSTDRGSTEGTIHAVQPNGTKVEATLRPEAPQVTSARIRVGTVGNRDEQRLIDQNIREQLRKG